MKSFNKYLFLEDLSNQLKTEIEKYNVDDMDSVHILIDEIINSECTYTSDCFEICIELDATDFNAYQWPVNNIEQLAFVALYDFVHAEFDYLEINDLIDNKVNA
jgi:hypothetical protein